MIKEMATIFAKTYSTLEIYCKLHCLDSWLSNKALVTSGGKIFRP